jgi:hypothetical protein
MGIEHRMKDHLPLLPMLIWFIFSCALLWRLEMTEQQNPWKLCSQEMPSNNELLYALIKNGDKKKVVLGKYIDNNWSLPNSDGYDAPVAWRPFNSMPGDEEVIK